RAQLDELAGGLGIALAAAGTHPWSPWQEQRIIDTPHYRRNDELLRYVVWRNNTFGHHVHVGIRGADRAIAVCNGLRNFLPELLALSASSVFVEGVFTHLHSTRTEIFTRMFPRCGVPDTYDGWQGFEDYVRFLYDTGSITEHTQIWWSVRTHLAFPTVEIRICDGQPDLEESRSLAALSYALTARIARAIDEGEPLPDHPHRLIEENLWRAIRYGLRRVDRALDRRGPPGSCPPRAPSRLGRAGCRRAGGDAVSGGAGRQLRRAPDRPARRWTFDGRDLRSPREASRARPWLRSSPRSRAPKSSSWSSSCRPSSIACRSRICCF